MRIPKRIRPVLRRVVPDSLRTYRGDLWRRRLVAATDRLWRETGGVVQGGPFAGMTYTRTEYSQLGPKLLGTYEQETREFVRRVIAADPPCVINVGAAEGYYAVGLLTRTRRMRVSAFERNEEGRTLMRELAELNGVADRLEIHGDCTPGALSTCLAEWPASPLLIDIEGGERHLLDPVAVPELAKCEILVEMHEFLAPGVTAQILERFEPTHSVRRIPAEERTARAIPAVAGLSASDRVRVAFERSAEDQEWLWLAPHPPGL
ncbi:MAG: hypothetical protein U5R14_06590 [Gemmatimonadota bacterium]|nr:hypothetical protein [Gemmatimonadota bacterium]